MTPPIHDKNYWQQRAIAAEKRLGHEREENAAWIITSLRAAKESAEQTVKALEKKLERADEFGQRGFQALVKALGLKTPLELIARAENNEETHLDIAVKVVAEKMNQLSAAEQTIAELRKLETWLLKWYSDMDWWLRKDCKEELRAIIPSEKLQSTLNKKASE